MIRRAYDAVRAATAGPVLVSVRAGQERFASLPAGHVRYVEDAASDAGPLAGLVAGLRTAETGWLLALACDLPFAAPDALRRLLDARTPDTDAVVAEAPDGRRQPLCACYCREAVLPVAEAHLRDGRLALHALLSRLAVRPVAVDAEVLRNVNRPADLPETDES